MKVIAIFLIVVQHAWTPETDSLYFSLGYFDYGAIGVTLFLVASGLGLAASKPALTNLSDLKNFYKTRLLRIYPSYWLFGLGFTIMLFPSLLNQIGNVDLWRLMTGFQSWGATNAEQYYGQINGTLWFIEIIVCMYLVFPLLYYLIKKKPKATIVVLFVISAVSQFYFISYTNYFQPYSWIPLCKVFEFGLGIFIIVKGKYPKTQSNWLVKYLSNISFYIFLTNSTLLNYFPYQIATFIIALFAVSTFDYYADKFLKWTATFLWNDLVKD